MKILAGRWGYHLSAHIHVPAVTPYAEFGQHLAFCVVKGKGKDLIPKLCQLTQNRQGMIRKKELRGHKESLVRVKGRESDQDPDMERWWGLKTQLQGGNYAWRGCERSVKQMTLSASGVERSRCKRNEGWTDTGWGEEGKARNPLSANFSEWGVYLKKVLLQICLVLKLFQSSTVSPTKDVFPSLEEVVITWHIRRWHLDMPS